MSINLLNTARPFEINSMITEWDMKRAGLNIIREFKLLPQKEIDRIAALPKLEGDIAVGKMQIRDKEFSKELENKFTEVMNLFLSENQIDTDFDVISIKKDACFVINKKISVSEFGTYIKFVPKNQYHAYLYLKPLEFYFKRDGSIDIKNLCSDKEKRKEIINAHKGGILNLLQYVIELAETTQFDHRKMNRFLHEFVEMYKKKELDFEYYREFNVENRFRYQFLDSEIMADAIDESMLEKVNILHNYKTIILPLINVVC